MIEYKKISGITLIALVVTIIVLLLLAGISISMLTGNNGILTKAGEAKELTENSSIKERIQLTYLYEISTSHGEINKDSFEEALKNEFGKDKVIVLSDDLTVVTIDGIEYATGVPMESVEGKISDKKGQNEDRVIAVSNQKNTLLEDDYGNIVKIPKGFGIATDSGTNINIGIVIEDADESRSTYGSQFVWVPVGKVYCNKEKDEIKNITLGRYIFKEDGTIEDSEDTSLVEITSENQLPYGDYNNDKYFIENSYEKIQKFINSVNQNKGYYIGRCEAGVKGTTSSNVDYPIETTYNGETIIQYEHDEESYMIDGSKFNKNSNTPNMIMTKPGLGVWNNILLSNATTVCENMYNKENDKIISDLTNSYAWDTAILYIQTCGNDSMFSRNIDPNTQLTTTGSNNDERCKIKDMAGNVDEWSSEMYSFSGTPYVSRGGCYEIRNNYTSYRRQRTGLKSLNTGFRPFLYF